MPRQNSRHNTPTHAQLAVIYGPASRQAGLLCGALLALLLPPSKNSPQTPPTGGRHRSIDYCRRATSPQAPGLGTTHYCQAWGYWLPCVHCVYVLAAMSDTRFLASVQYQSAPLDLKTATSAATDSNRSQCPRTHRTRRAYGCARCNCMLLLLVVVSTSSSLDILNHWGS